MLTKILLAGLVALGALAGPNALGTTLPERQDSVALIASGPIDGNWLQGTNGIGSVVADMYDVSPTAPRFRMFAKLIPHDVPGHTSGTIVGKITDAESPDPHKTPGLLGMVGSWQRTSPNSGTMTAVLFMQGPLIPVMPIGAVAGSYQLSPLEGNPDMLLGPLQGRYAING